VQLSKTNSNKPMHFLTICNQVHPKQMQLEKVSKETREAVHVMNDQAYDDTLRQTHWC
jgi:hypothetical protein